jgi:hypothetical protein
MQTHNVDKTTGLIIAAVIVCALGVAAVAVWRMDPGGDDGSGLTSRFSYDDQDADIADPKLIEYDRVAEIPLDMDQPRAIAVNEQDRILVAGDNVVHVFSSDGEKLADFTVGGSPTAIAVAPQDAKMPGRILVAIGDVIRLFDATGKPEGTWRLSGEKPVRITSIAVDVADVFVADFGNRAVRRLDMEGRTVQTIEHRGTKGEQGEFNIPSAFFDVAIADDEVLRVAHTGMNRIESYTYDGDPLGSWGVASARPIGFFGCCNPAHFALLPDGRYVTAEKGIVRVKVHDADGEFVCLVADPKTLARPVASSEAAEMRLTTKWIDVAADRQGRVLVLDPIAKHVWIYESRSEGSK